MLCSEAILVNQDGTAGHAITLKCKRWCCEICRPVNHRRIKRAAREGRPNTFLTLTVDPSKHSSPDQAAQALKTAWVNLRRAMERELGIKRPPFIAVFEETKAGWPHLHILMRSRYVAQKWYSDTMRRLIGAYIVHVRWVPEVSRVAAYVAKYVSKAPTAFNHTKRWWRSHDYQVEKEECEPFRRYGPHVAQWSERIGDYLWRTYGGRAQYVETREGYWRWTVSPTGPPGEGSAYKAARA